MRAYLDHNATSPLRPQARKAMLAALEATGNPSSVHAEGRAARALVEDARKTIAVSLGVLPAMVIFTGVGTEANNHAIKGAPVERLIISAIEHSCVLEAARATGKPLEIIPVSGEGIVDLDALEKALERGRGRALVSIMLANNETGAIQPVRKATEIAHEHGALIHTDAVQAFGKQPVNFALLGVDMMTLSAHKIGGPQGVGALIIRDGVKLEKLMHGGGQELGRRGGTENVAGIAGFAAAARAACEAINEKESEIRVLRDSFESQLQGVSPDVTIFSRNVARLDNTSYFAVPGITAQTALISLDLDGVSVSSGSACSSGKVSGSAVLAAMGVEENLRNCALRISFGWNSTKQDTEQFIASWRKLVERHNKTAAA